MGISKWVASCATLLAALAGGVALGMWSGDLFAGAEIKISMAGSKYAPAKVSARVGDTLNFVNDDTADHWVYVPTVGQQVSGGPQKPGQSFKFIAGTPGDFEVDCAFHTNMVTQVTIRR